MSAPVAGAASVNARSLAVHVVARVLQEGITLDQALGAALAAPPQVSAAIRSLSYGAVRGYFRHEAVLGRLLSQPVRSLAFPVRALLSVALFELEDARTPEYAVVDAAVKVAKSAGRRAGGLVNAVLRRYLRERRTLNEEVARDPAARHASPGWLAERLRTDWPDRWTELLAALDARAPMWLRADRRRTSAEAYIETLRAAGMPARAEPRVAQAVELEAARDVADLPGFADGVVSVQDLGAQCVAFALALEPGLRVLDACAAPGGKTSLMAEREPRLARLVALDIDPWRLERVRENLARGRLEAELVAGDAASPEGWWDGVPFDRILIDAPCSALGVIRRHPDIRLRRSSKDIEKMPKVQGRLLAAAWRMLARGGRLVYATCTLTRSENRGVIAAFLDATPDARIVPPEQWDGWPGFGAADGFGRQILPGEAGADGFYYAALIKR
jgi:16S rRNA (cytosine967-C5)-methyltransferase